MGLHCALQAKCGTVAGYAEGGPRAEGHRQLAAREVAGLRRAEPGMGQA